MKIHIRQTNEFYIKTKLEEKKPKKNKRAQTKKLDRLSASSHNRTQIMKNHKTERKKGHYLQLILAAIKLNKIGINKALKNSHKTLQISQKTPKQYDITRDQVI